MNGVTYTKERSRYAEVLGLFYTSNIDNQSQPLPVATWYFVPTNVHQTMWAISLLTFESIDRFFRSLMLQSKDKIESTLLFAPHSCSIYSPILLSISDARLVAFGESPASPNADVFIQCTLRLFVRTGNTTDSVTEHGVVDCDTGRVFLDNGGELTIPNIQDALDQLGKSAAEFQEKSS